MLTAEKEQEKRDLIVSWDSCLAASKKGMVHHLDNNINEFLLNNNDFFWLRPGQLLDDFLFLQG